MNMLKQATMALVLGVGIVGLAEAHHAVNSQFDANKTIPFNGVLERTYIGNPHSYLYFLRMMPNGQTQKWTFETDAVLALKRAGLSVRHSFRLGETYSITYNPALDGSNAGLMTAIRLQDGRIISMSTKDQQQTAINVLNKELPPDSTNGLH